MDYDKTAIPAAYNRGRDHGPIVLAQWMDAVAACVAPGTVTTILDLGCGTGRFSSGLAERFRAGVVGIDPSKKMLSEARSTARHPSVFYACACAEALPLAPATVDLIFISMVFHHFTDPERAAQECNRVIRPEGRVCLRTAAREMISEYAYVPFFPGSRPLLEERLPTLAFQQEVFERTGLSTLSSAVVVQQIAENLSSYADKLSAKADSILASLDELEFDAGMRALRHASATTPSRAVTEPINLIVFGKSARGESDGLPASRSGAR